MSSSSGKAAAYLFMGMLFGIGSYLYGLALYRLYKLIQYTPTSKAVSAAPGICEVAGTARPQGELQTAPFTKKICVYFRTNIYKWSGSGKHRSRSLAKSFQGHNRFYIQDDSGQIAIDPPGDDKGGSVLWAGWNMVSKHKASPQNYLKLDVSASTGAMASGGFNTKTTLMVIAAMIVLPLLALVFMGIGFLWGLLIGVPLLLVALWVMSRGKNNAPSTPPTNKVREFLRSAYPSLANYGDRIDVEETYIEPGDPIYILGTAKAVEGDPDAISVGFTSDNGIFCISDGSEKEARGKAGWNAYLFGLGGPLLFAGCALMLFQAYVKGDFGNWLTGLILPAVILMYGVFLLINLLELYNGTIRLRQNIERAKANVDALYVMRHELIPQLQEVVRGYIEHEKTVQELSVKIRVAAEDQNPASLAMVAENYPELKANENFLLLQKQLETIAERLAGSQSYVVDATTLYNARVQSFPYFLFTPLVGLHSMPMPQFGATSA